MKKLLAILLAVVMVLGLAACNSSGETTIVGTWKGEMDVGAVLAALIQQDVDQKIPCKMIFEFSPEGKLTTKMDEESAKKAVDAMVDVMIDMIRDLYAEEGGDLDAELAAEGMSVEDLKNQYREEMDLDDMLGDASEDSYYKFENGKIYVADEKEDLEEGDYDTCYIATLSGNKLTITDIETDGELASEALPGVFPLVFKK